LDGRAGLICGEDTAGQIDEEVLSVINSCYEEAYNLLLENKEVLDRISEYLYEKETITGKEFMQIFREMKGIEEPEVNPEEMFEEEKMKFTDADDAVKPEAFFEEDETTGYH
jgi:cell division protease FtsH